VDKYENGKVPKNIVMPRAGGKTENAGLTYDQKWAWEPRPGDKEEIAAAHADGGLPVPPELVPAIEKMQNDGVIACGASIVVGPAPSVYSGESGREAIIARVAADRRDEAAVILNRELKLRGLRPDGKLVAPESIRFVPDGIAYSFKG
jgi:hypothetical protein